MEFLDEEARPKFYFQSRVSSTPNSERVHHKIDKLQFAICSLVSLVLLLFSIFYFHESHVIQFLLFWMALSLLIGPLAPVTHTGGEINVGKGEIIHPSDPDPAQLDEPKNRQSIRRSKARKPEDGVSSFSTRTIEPVIPEKCDKKSSPGIPENEKPIVDEKDWTEEEYELLKKQLTKHPVGTPQRWELITEAFQGRHGLDSVVKTAKSLSTKRVVGDSFAQFLKQRKPFDKRLEAQVEASNVELPGSVVVPEDDASQKKGGDSNWSSGEDLALLNALKAFPKDSSMRWEKIAAAVPGRSKAGCMKRMAELKRDFRNSKVSET